MSTGEAAAECVSDDALIHLKSYKYSAVDKSPVSHYILRPYVRTAPSNRIETCASSREPSPLPLPGPRCSPAHARRYQLTTRLGRTVELGCRSLANMACAEHGHFDRLLLHPGQRRPMRLVGARPDRTGTPPARVPLKRCAFVRTCFTQPPGHDASGTHAANRCSSFCSL